MIKLARNIAQTFAVTSLLALFAAGGPSAFAEEVPVTPDVGPPSEKSAPRTGEHGVRSLDLDDPAAGTDKGAERVATRAKSSRARKPLPLRAQPHRACVNAIGPRARATRAIPV